MKRAALHTERAIQNQEEQYERIKWAAGLIKSVIWQEG
jgi:hypothetical protein